MELELWVPPSHTLFPTVGASVGMVTENMTDGASSSTGREVTRSFQKEGLQPQPETNSHAARNSDKKLLGSFPAHHPRLLRLYADRRPQVSPLQLCDDTCGYLQQRIPLIGRKPHGQLADGPAEVTGERMRACQVEPPHWSKNTKEVESIRYGMQPYRIAGLSAQKSVLPNSVSFRAAMRSEKER